MGVYISFACVRLIMQIVVLFLDVFRSWCDQYGDVVLDVVRKEFKDHVGQMSAGREKYSSKRWTTFDDDENCHPNLFPPGENLFYMKQSKSNALKNDHLYAATNSNIEKGFKYNPFFDV